MYLQVIVTLRHGLVWAWVCMCTVYDTVLHSLSCISCTPITRNYCMCMLYIHDCVICVIQTDDNISYTWGTYWNWNWFVGIKSSSLIKHTSSCHLLRRVSSWLHLWRLLSWGDKNTTLWLITTSCTMHRVRITEWQQAWYMLTSHMKDACTKFNALQRGVVQSQHRGMIN